MTGWSFDPDGPTRPVRVEAWIDGKRGQAGARKVSLGYATLTRADVARVHKRAGARHGFKTIIGDVPPGKHEVRVYALNRFAGGGTTYLGGETVRVPEWSPDDPVGDDPVGEDPVGDDPIGGATSDNWYLRNSNTGGPGDITFNYGKPGDVPVVGDWNGDGIDTPGVVMGGDNWYLRNSNTPGAADIVFNYGSPGAIPFVGDWNGDGIDTPGVVTGGDNWYLRNSNTGGPANITFNYGSPGEIPFAGDWNGDGIDTPGITQ